MKQSLILLLLLQLTSPLVLAQMNLVPNWNFEGPDEFGNFHPPCGPVDNNEIFLAFPWSGGSWLTISNTIYGPHLNDTRAATTTGIFSPCTSDYGPTAPNNYYGSQTPKSGLRYITLAAGTGEHHYAKVPLTTPIYYGDEIYLSMYVSQGDYTESLGFEVIISDDDEWSNDDITIYEGVADNKTDWVEHTSQTTVSGPSNDLDEHGCGPWHYLLIGANYNVATSAMYIDDVSLTKSFDCLTENSCLPRTGPIDIAFVKPHYDGHPFCAVGCDKLTYLKMEIWDVLSNSLMLSYELDYPPNRVCWDARTSWGADVANGLYEYRLTTRAHCVCTKVYEGTFQKIGESFIDDSGFYFHLNSQLCEVPEYCCGSEMTSWSISDCSINSAQVYDVRNEILVSNSVIEEGHSLHLKAGNRIELTDFNSGDNTTFIAEIVSCPSFSGRYGIDTYWSDPLMVESGREAKGEPTAIPTLYPNPTTGLITYTGTGPLNSATVMDLTGRTLHTQGCNGTTTATLDLSPYQPGTYLLRLQYTTGKAETHRVVRQ